MQSATYAMIKHVFIEINRFIFAAETPQSIRNIFSIMLTRSVSNRL